MAKCLVKKENKMSLEEARNKWFRAGKSYYQREANSFSNKKHNWPPFESLSVLDKDFFMAKAAQLEQEEPVKEQAR